MIQGHMTKGTKDNPRVPPVVGSREGAAGMGYGRDKRYRIRRYRGDICQQAHGSPRRKRANTSAGRANGRATVLYLKVI